ncbi:MAG TPA: pyrroline-5-carboxylate reductase [Pseudomonadales bacterium]|jgi:pyrroline-5-carboxylate reductase|nr:pyrroline-5-carboxylate reductase [Pseudomonadales bacterium]
MHQPTIGFIGAGNMAASLMGGLVARGYAPQQLCAADPNAAGLQALAQQHGIHACASNAEVAQRADILVLAVKPQVMQAVLTDLAPAIHSKHLLISIAAGISMTSMAQWLGGTPAIVRCMPNTPALVQQGASGLVANAQVSAAQREQAEAILKAVGIALWLDNEAQIDAVTAVSGSGPAYFFLLMEAMISAGEKLGLSTETSRALTLQTALGAAQMACSSEFDPAELRRRVTSPGGTTERAIAHFELQNLRDIVEGALHAASARSLELSQQLG